MRPHSFYKTQHTVPCSTKTKTQKLQYFLYTRTASPQFPQNIIITCFRHAVPSYQRVPRADIKCICTTSNTPPIVVAKVVASSIRRRPWNIYSSFSEIYTDIYNFYRYELNMIIDQTNIRFLINLMSVYLWIDRNNAGFHTKIEIEGIKIVTFRCHIE